MNLNAVIRSTMYSKFCGVPKAKVAVCPSVGWLKDFADAQTVLDPTFNGKNILPSNNSNWPQLNDPKINAAMDQAETILDPVGACRRVGQDRRPGDRGCARDPVALGQGPVDRVEERERRSEPGERGLGPVLHVAQVMA